MIVIIQCVNLVEMSSSIMMSNIKVFYKKKITLKKNISYLVLYDHVKKQCTF